MYMQYNHVLLYSVNMMSGHSFAGMGTISGLKVAGYSACPSCGPELHGRYSVLLHKTTYEGSRVRLPMDDHMRRNTTHWARTEFRPCPNGPSAEAQIQMAEMVEAKLLKPKDCGVNRRSALWDLIGG